ncbi:MAG: hypothetical protein IT320_00245 [Anaerolineae bacterium]|nr:hypothetical protein [Anaerolineae bacterium]
MEPNTLFLLLAGLACSIIMGVMMWLMNKNMRHQQTHSASDGKQKGMSAASRLVELREQRQILEDEIAELTQITELEEQHKALLTDSLSAPDVTPISAMR